MVQVHVYAYTCNIMRREICRTHRRAASPSRASNSPHTHTHTPTPTEGVLRVQNVTHSDTHVPWHILAMLHCVC